MHKYLLFLFFLNPFFSLAQGPFAPQGAEWWYNLYDPWADKLTGLPTYMSARGTANIQGQLCRQLTVIEVDFTYGLHIYSQNDSVFIYDDWGGDGWRLLYDYSARPGDTWEIPGVSESLRGDQKKTMTVRVDSVGMVTFCDQPLRAWYISYDTTQFLWGNRIVEWVGNTFSLMPCLVPATSYIQAPLRCYRDKVHTCKAAPYRCDTIWASVREQDAAAWSLSPNPTGDLLKVEVTDRPMEDGTVQLYSLISGRLVQSAVLPESGQVQVSLSMLPAGNYIAILRDKGQIVGRRKVVVVR